MMNDKTKKDFQKVIAEIRNDRRAMVGRAVNYPKPMMTAVQIEKRTATVNCGGEFADVDTTIEIAKMVVNDERFKAFLAKYDAFAYEESNQFGTMQIRVRF